MPNMSMDEDAMDAAVNLIGRTGATEINIGYHSDDVPVGQPNWYAKATLGGTEIVEDMYPGPAEATEALARRLMDGGKCTNCGRLISLSSKYYKTAPGTFTDGSPVEQAAAAGICRWTRNGKRWDGDCKATG